jgi:predicted hydrocarbon binding protein
MVLLGGFFFLEETVMLNLSDEPEDFTWNAIGDIKEGRENLGEEMPVLVYRLFQYTMNDVLTKRYGAEEAANIHREAGVVAGTEFAKNVLDLSLPFNGFIAHLQEKLLTLKIGVLRIEEFDKETGRGIFTVGEDLDCSGLPVTGETVCFYDEGFLAGVLGSYTKKTYNVKEIDCWATGSRVCRFRAEVKN